MRLAAAWRREEQDAAGAFAGLGLSLTAHGPQAKMFEVLQAAELVEVLGAPVQRDEPDFLNCCDSSPGSARSFFGRFANRFANRCPVGGPRVAGPALAYPMNPAVPEVGLEPTRHCWQRILSAKNKGFRAAVASRSCKFFGNGACHLAQDFGAGRRFANSLANNFWGPRTAPYSASRKASRWALQTRA